MQREQFTHRGCHPDAEVTVALRMQTKSSRQSWRNVSSVPPAS